MAPAGRRPGDSIRIREAEERGAPFLIMRDGEGVQHIVPLEGTTRVLVGRADDSDVVITGDPSVSRAHAELTFVGGVWTLGDDGLSRNGTFVQDRRVVGRTRLADGDLIRVGQTSLQFRDPGETTMNATVTEGGLAQVIGLTPAQRRVLVALATPYLVAGGGYPSPASNKQIADALVIEVDTVKATLTALFRLFDLADLPHGHKRAALVDKALRAGIISADDRAQP